MSNTISEEKQKVMWGRQNQAKEGSLGLPALLEKRRLEFGLPDGAFKSQAVYDRVFVWQLPLESSETYEGTSILKTEVTKRVEHEEAPRGIIVSAGLKALDSLRSNGIDVGHIVSFVRLAPYRLPVGRGFRGLEAFVIILRDGDVIASEDLMTELRSGQRWVEVNSGGEHNLSRCGIPQVPQLNADY